MAKGWLKLGVNVLAMVLLIYERMESHRVMSIIAKEVNLKLIMTFLEMLYRHVNPILHLFLITD
jgi:hypothetical protein